jgi:hypothetical protein
MRGVGTMPDHSDEFRRTAANCISVARTITDPGRRVIVLTMAQRWYDLANGPAINFDSLVREFNEGQMSDRLVIQQQQIQPK